MKKILLGRLWLTIFPLFVFACSTTAPTIVTPEGVPAEPLTIESVDPPTFQQGSGGTITIIGTGFDEKTFVNLSGAGLLETTVLNSKTATAVIDSALDAGEYTVKMTSDQGTADWSGVINIIAIEEMAQNGSKTEATNKVAAEDTATPEPVEPTEEAAEVTPVPPTATATAVLPTETPTIEPLSCRTLVSMNLRYGPGISYNPPLTALPAEADLTPLAFSSQGFPDGQWIEVQDNSSGTQGWISAGSQFVSCNFDILSLPNSTNIPATPTPIPTPTAPPTPTAEQPVAIGPPRVTNNGIGGADDGFNGVILNSTYFMHVQVRDQNADDDIDGLGIDRVEFFVSENDSGRVVYRHTEKTAKYCIFKGGEPDCTPWPSRDGVHTWGEGGEPVVYGLEYFVSVVAYTKGDDVDVYDWSGPFTVNP